jgi:glycosyltransferase involved in cell wall biosynthesis
MRSSKDLAAALAERQLPIRVIYVASYPPRKCGIATFTKDLTTAINNANPEAPAEIIAMNDHGQDYDYPWEVKLRIRQHRRTDYEMAARYINQSSADVVCLQHEFGLYGGPEGDYSTCLSAGGEVKLPNSHKSSRFYLIDMLEAVRKPIVTTFHTILPEPDPEKLYAMARVIELSSAVIAMTEDARKVLIDVYGCPPEKAVVIYHGVPDFTFNNIVFHKQKLHMSNALPMLLSAGLLGPGKGIEYCIEAMPEILRVLPQAKLYVVGQTHPVILRNDGEEYRESLKRLASKLKVTKSVKFINEYLENSTLHSYYQAADFFVTPYPNLQQSASGTLAWALGAGKVAISTPYVYAKELLGDNTGVLIDPVSSTTGHAIAERVLKIYQDQKLMHRLRERAYAKGRKFSWPSVGVRYINLFKLVAKQHKAAKPHVPLFGASK